MSVRDERAWIPLVWTNCHPCLANLMVNGDTFDDRRSSSRPPANRCLGRPFGIAPVALSRQRLTAALPTAPPNIQPIAFPLHPWPGGT